MDIMFILHAEHEMNCSTAAARHLASSGVDVYTAISGDPWRKCQSIVHVNHLEPTRLQRRLLSKRQSILVPAFCSVTILPTEVLVSLARLPACCAMLWFQPPTHRRVWALSGRHAAATYLKVRF